MFSWNFGSVKEPPKESVGSGTVLQGGGIKNTQQTSQSKLQSPITQPVRRWGYCYKDRRRSLASQKPEFLD